MRKVVIRLPRRTMALYRMIRDLVRACDAARVVHAAAFQRVPKLDANLEKCRTHMKALRAEGIVRAMEHKVWVEKGMKK